MPDSLPLFDITAYIDRHGGGAATLRALVAQHGDTLTLTFRTRCGHLRRWTLPLTSAQEFVEVLDEACPALPPPQRR